MKSTKTNALEIKISADEWAAMAEKERELFINTIMESLTPEQKEKMAEIGRRAILDDVYNRTHRRSRTALRTMAREVHVVVNETNL